MFRRQRAVREKPFQLVTLGICEEKTRARCDKSIILYCWPTNLLTFFQKYSLSFHNLAGHCAMTCECKQANVSPGIALQSPPLILPMLWIAFATVFASFAHLAKPSVTIGIHSGVSDSPEVKYFWAAARSTSPFASRTFTVLKTHSPMQFWGDGGPDWNPTCRFCTLVCRKSEKQRMKIWSSTTFGWLQHVWGFLEELQNLIRKEMF